MFAPRYSRVGSPNQPRTSDEPQDLCNTKSDTELHTGSGQRGLGTGTITLMSTPQITAVRGDITTIAVDAVVNAANNAMRGGGGVDGAIHRAGGPAVLADCIARFPRGLATGDAGWTAAGDLPARWVIHTVGPDRRAGQTDRGLLESCYRRSLEVADELGARSVAFPSSARVSTAGRVATPSPPPSRPSRGPGPTSRTSASWRSTSRRSRRSRPCWLTLLTDAGSGQEGASVLGLAADLCAAQPDQVGEHVVGDRVLGRHLQAALGDVEARQAVADRVDDLGAEGKDADVRLRDIDTQQRLPGQSPGRHPVAGAFLRAGFGRGHHVADVGEGDPDLVVTQAGEIVLESRHRPSVTGC